MPAERGGVGEGWPASHQAGGFNMQALAGESAPLPKCYGVLHSTPRSCWLLVRPALPQKLFGGSHRWLPNLRSDPAVCH